MEGIHGGTNALPSGTTEGFGRIPGTEAPTKGRGLRVDPAELLRAQKS